MHQACNFIKKETLAQLLSCEFCEISKNTFSYRTPPVAASENNPHRLQSFSSILLARNCNVLLTLTTKIRRTAPKKEGKEKQPKTIIPVAFLFSLALRVVLLRGSTMN